MVLAGPSRHLWLCHVCLVCLVLPLVIRFIQTSMALPCTPCMACIFALYCLVFSSSEDAISRAPCARFWHRLGLESCWGSGVSQPCPHRASHGFSTVLRFISTSMALPCNPVHPNIYGFAVSALYMYCLVLVHLYLAVLQIAISRASLPRPLAPSWGIHCFPTMPYSAPQGFSMVLAGPSRHLWLCHVCLVCLVLPLVIRFIQTSISFALYALYMYCLVLVHLYLAVLKMLFREHLCAGLWRRLGLESCWASGVSQPRLFHGTGRSIQTSMALPCMPCMPCIALSSLRTFLAPPWAWILLGIRCFATMPPPCSTGRFHGIPVHPNIYGFAFYALYAL